LGYGNILDFNSGFNLLSPFMKISQSFMKSFAAYMAEEECGLSVKAKYIDGIPSESSEAMKLGQYFEYMATGGLPAYGDGTPPEPEVVYKGKPNEKLSEKYERARQSAIYFKAMIQSLGIEIVSVGQRLETENKTGTTDLIANWNGKLCIIDLKYSGLLDDKWNDLGWHEDFLDQKEKILTQAVHYKLLAKEHFKQEVDFYFFVFSTSDPMDVRVFQIHVDPSKQHQHDNAVNNMITLVQKELKNGFTAYPELKRCNKCHLRDTCDQRALLPKVKQIFY
jgi:hypothetical protein